MLAFALTIIFSFWNPYKTSNLHNNFFPISEPAPTVEKAILADDQLRVTPLTTAVDYDDGDEDCSEDDKDLDDDTSVTDISESLSSDSCSDLDISY